MLRSFFAILLQQVQAVWRTVTRTGTGIIVADDTTEGIPLTIEMQGWTKQEGKPSPEHPQEIVSAGKYDEESQKYSVDVKLTGKNIFDFSQETTEVVQYYYSKKIDGLIVGKKYTASLYGDLDNITKWMYINDTGGSKFANAIKTVSGTIKQSITFIATSETMYVVTNVKKNYDYINKFQIEMAENKTEYQDYREPQSVTITSDRPVSHLDRLEYREGVYGWAYGGKIYKVTGSEYFNFGNDRYYTGASTSMFTTLKGMYEQPSEDSENAKCKCYRLQYVPDIWRLIEGDIGFALNSNQIHFRFPNTLLGVADDATKEEKMAAFKTYISRCAEEGNPVTVQYKLATPEFVPLPEEEQAALKALKTYFQTTVVANDDNMFMQIEYKTRIPEQEV